MEKHGRLQVQVQWQILQWQLQLIALERVYLLLSAGPLLSSFATAGIRVSILELHFSVTFMEKIQHSGTPLHFSCRTGIRLGRINSVVSLLSLVGLHNAEIWSRVRITRTTDGWVKCIVCINGWTMKSCPYCKIPLPSGFFRDLKSQQGETSNKLWHKDRVSPVLRDVDLLAVVRGLTSPAVLNWHLREQDGSHCCALWWQ